MGYFQKYSTAYNSNRKQGIGKWKKKLLIGIFSKTFKSIDFQQGARDWKMKNWNNWLGYFQKYSTANMEQGIGQWELKLIFGKMEIIDKDIYQKYSTTGSKELGSENENNFIWIF